MKFKIITPVILAISVTSAYAASNIEENNTEQVSLEGFNVGLGLGMGNVYIKNISSIADFIGEVHIGYDWAISNNTSIGIQAKYVGYSGLFSTIATAGLLKYTSAEMVPIFFKAQYTTDIGFNVFGKAGVAYSQVTQDATASSIEITRGQANPIVGVGVGWQIGRFNLFLETNYLITQTSHANNNDTSDAYTGGLSYTF